MPVSRQVLLSAAISVLSSSAVSITSWAQVPTVGPLTLVAREDVFASCTADDVAGQPGTVYPNTHIEPSLAINPRNVRDLVVGMHQDRWNNGGARGTRGAVSFDGGATWKATTTPKVTKCQGGPWPRASDPWVSFSPDGTAYYSQLTTEALANPNIFGRSGQVVGKSVDGGVTWGNPTTLVDTPAELDEKKPQVLHDKNSVTADPDNSNLAYVVWDKLVSYTPGAGTTDDGHNPEPDAIAAVSTHDGLSITRNLRSAALKRQAGRSAESGTPTGYPVYVQGPTLFARTFDHGQTWEKPKIIYNPGDNNQTIGNQIVKLPDGRLADFFTFQNDLTGADAIGFVTSSDNGKTWGQAYFPEVFTTTPALTPNKQEDIRSADILFSVAVDRANGVIWLTWEDTRYTGVNEVSVAYSTDGYSWYGPVRANQTPRNPTHPYFQQGLIPTVTTMPDGTAVVTYYDFRNDKVGAKADLADYWAIVCNPFVVDCTVNSAWHAEVKVNTFSFDYDLAPVAEGHFLGDYMGLKSVGQTAHSVFGVSESLNKTTLYTRPIYVPIYNKKSGAKLVAAGAVASR